ncbi:MAG: TRAP transporter large permease subunit [Planctomycetota bacterium]|jgi:C4-dicarboxylate transporter DctM subunit
MKTTERTLPQILVSIIDHISVVFGFIAGLAMLFVAINTAYEAIARRVFDSPTTWIFSMSLFVMVWFPLLAAAFITKEGRQIKVDFLFSRLSEQVQSKLNIINYFLSIVFIIVLGYYGLDKCIEAYTSGVKSTGLLLYPQWMLDIVFPVTMVLLLLQTVKFIYLEVTQLMTNGLSTKKGWEGNSTLVVSLFFILITLGTYLILVKPIVGIIFLALCLMIGGLPVSFSLGCTGIAGLSMIYSGYVNLPMVPVIVEKTLHNFVLLAVPMFIMAGVTLDKIGVGERIFDFASKWLNILPGGLAVGTVIACALFSAMIGVSIAVAAAIGLIAIPSLLSRGYTKEIAYGSVAGGALGILIPPSAGLIFYGFLTNSSVGALFAAAFLPALVIVVMFSGYVIIRCLIDGGYERVSYSWKERFISLKRAGWGLTVPIIILGGIYSGFFTPTEAAGVLVVYSLIIGLIYKKVNLKQLMLILKESALFGSAVLMIMVGAMVLAHLVIRLQVASSLTEYIATSGVPGWLALTIIMILYLILGMFLDGLSITVLTVPVLFPLMPVLGVDVIVFGVFLMIFIETSLLTPPVGVNLFMVQAITGDNLWPIVKGNAPFAVLLLLGAILLLIFPQLALWLPKILGL